MTNEEPDTAETAATRPPFRIIVLGAGFSRPAGFPLAINLWGEILERVDELGLPAAKFKRDLESYTEYRSSVDGVELTPKEVDFEDLMRFLDIEHHLGLRGKDTWSEEGNEGTLIVKGIIGAVLTSYLAPLDPIPDLYLEFARRLRPHDIVITFNYDNLLERSLDSVGNRYRLFPVRYREVREDGRAIADEDKEEITLLKMHGSIDWFDKTHFDRRIELMKQHGADAPKSVVFSHMEELGVTPVTDGPRHPRDPLRNTFRVKNIEKLYESNILLAETPRLLSPSSAKLLYANQLHDFWYELAGAGAYNRSVSIVGFSMPQQDEYVRQAIYTLVANYQTVEWDEEMVGRRKQPLVLVDLFANEDAEAQYRERFRFVNWDRAIPIGDGFGFGALDAIFA